MPVVSIFYGIIIKMFFRDHNPPHLHAVYGEFNGLIDLRTLEMFEGDLPPRAYELVREWAKNYQEILLEMWENQEFKKLPGLK
ncbi:MAG: hypothetical protein CVV22_04155 [Ignavibacteriae bacterium HGW-Ignavibacteriae-1]|jgi:hypothetical protein|nr:MAG: hypothetical protein CVV22_04155 [Ignavibacteriae bacterium HGW-Ignavibacteriae-1]